MFTNQNKTIRSALIGVFGLISAWTYGSTSPVYGVLVALPLILIQEFSLSILIKRYMLQVFNLASGIVIAEVFSGSSFLIFASSIIFLAFVIYRIKTWQEAVFVPSIIFYFIFGVVNTSYGQMEHSLYNLIENIIIQLPIGWLLFKILPTSKNSRSVDIVTKNFTLEDKNFSFVIVTFTLLVFLLVDLTTSIFCVLVITSCAFSNDKKTLLSNIKNIIPIQVGGCLIGLVINIIMFINAGNVIWAAIVLLSFVAFYLFYHHNTHLRVTQHSDINYENNILRAALIPISLYTSPNGLYVNNYFHRSFDMLATTLIMYILYLLVKNCREVPDQKASDKLSLRTMKTIINSVNK